MDPSLSFDLRRPRKSSGFFYHKSLSWRGLQLFLIGAERLRMSQDALPSRIAAEIATMIIAGDLAAEDRLTTQSLSERFAVSRTPVRGALMLLEQQGLVL